MDEVRFLGQVNLRIDPGGAAAEQAAAALGVPLPVTPNTAASGGGLDVLWLGPDEWLVLGPAHSGERIEALLRSAIGGEFASVVDVSAQRRTLVLRGPDVRELLAHGCSIDLHPRVFGAGRCAQTALARAPVVLLPRADNEVWVLVTASYAEYLGEWLEDAAELAEVGFRWRSGFC